MKGDQIVPYLRLIQPNMQKLAETVASALEIEVAIADKNLTRIVGTGVFYSKLDKNCPDDSLFAKVIKSGKPIINIVADDYCRDCSDKNHCLEFTNMSYPIRNNNQVVGVVSFATFDIRQANLMTVK